MTNKSLFSKMETLINPRSIAIIGASETTMYGRGILNSLKENNYKGKIFPVNLKRDEVLGVKCFRSLSAIEETIDLAIVIIGRQFILNTLNECVANKVNGIMIITSGFAEADEEGKKLENLIKQFAAEKEIAILGPNCAGFANFKNGIIATLLREEGRAPLPGEAAFVSQSGALMMALIGVARDKGIGLNYAISTGNEVDLEATDFMEYMLEDPSNKVITAFVEGFKDVEHFMRVAELALEKDKPLCILKVGRSEFGEKAAASHTGSITGADVAYDTIFREKGVIRSGDTQELIEISKVCSITKRPKSDGIAIITSSGGAGSLFADLCADYSLDVPDMSHSTLEKLVGREELLTFGTLSNPIDVRGQGIRALNQVLPIVLRDENYGMAVVIMCYSAVGEEASKVATMVRDTIINKESDKPVFVLWIGRRQRLVGNSDIKEGYEILERSGIPVFDEPQKCCKIIRKIIDYTKTRKKYLEGRNKASAFKPFSRIEQVKEIVGRGEGGLTEYDSKRILSLYGILVTRENLAFSSGEAAKIAMEIGYPVVLKVMSPQILHKTEAAVYKLNIREEYELKKAYDALLRNASEFNPNADIQGVLVQEMVPAGVEVILGMKRDLQFGPLIMFGLGGIFVEIFEDVSYSFPPIFEEEAYEMIQKTKGYKILRGGREKKEYDIEALVDTIVKFSYLSMDTAKIFTEIDINPLNVGIKGQGIKAIDSVMYK